MCPQCKGLPSGREDGNIVTDRPVKAGVDAGRIRGRDPRRRPRRTDDGVSNRNPPRPGGISVGSPNLTIRSSVDRGLAKLSTCQAAEQGWAPARRGGGKGLAKGSTDDPTRPGRSAGPGVPSGLDRGREVARNDKDAPFTALLHHVDLSRLWAAYVAVNPKAAPRVDQVTWDAYGQNLRETSKTCSSGSTGAPTGQVLLAGCRYAPAPPPSMTCSLPRSPRPQGLVPSRPKFHRPRQKEADSSGSTCRLTPTAFVRGRSQFEQPPLHQRHRGRNPASEKRQRSSATGRARSVQ